MAGRGRRQGRRRAVAADRTGTLLGVAVVLVIAAAVIGGAVWVNAHKSGESSGSIPTVASAPAGLAVALDRRAATVTIGRETATTVDLYEDLLCPVCQQFEHAYGDQLLAGMTSGTIRLRYHLVNLLDERSDPPGYSLRAANAALVVADVAPGKFLDFYRSLLAAQPAEGARGYDTGQLADLATRLGATDPRVAEQMTSGVHDRAIQNSLATAAAEPALRRPATGGGTSFGTPTVAVGGTLVDIGVPNWLDLLSAGSRPTVPAGQ